MRYSVQAARCGGTHSPQARSTKAAGETVDQIRAKGGSAQALRVDVSRSLRSTERLTRKRTLPHRSQPDSEEKPGRHKKGDNPFPLAAMYAGMDVEAI